jgi:dienelactone hydrolase
VGSAPETWTFDVCTNTWTQMHAAPPQSSTNQLVYDVDSDMTIGSFYGNVWAYDLQADTWTEKGAAPIDVTSWTYDPVSGLVVAWSDEEPWNYDVETDAWTLIDQSTELSPGGYVQFAYDTSVDRIVAYDNGNATSLFDIRTGTWTGSDTETPRVQAFYGLSSPAIAYDEAAERTVVKGWDLAVYDAAADRWDVTGTDVDGHRMAYDPVNERLVVHGGSGEMTAIETRTGKSTVLLEPRPVDVTNNVAYESANPVTLPGVLDVYAPARGGGWPVVVMFHGGPPLDKADLRQKAERVADLGFVVFAATWGAGGDFPPSYEQLLANQSQAACAVAFARKHAAEYGGDPETMIVFGHSAGANMAALTAFARPEPTAGCLGGTELGAIDALVTYEGDWVAMGPDVPWDSQITADPRILHGYTPMSFLPEHPDLRVVMLVSEHPGAEHRVSDAAAVESFIVVRDPSGDLRGYLEANDAFADGAFDLAETQQVLFSALEAQGNPVSLEVMPGSTHLSLSPAGWEVFLEAFGGALDQD